jgi:hypothetical protein
VVVPGLAWFGDDRADVSIIQPARVGGRLNLVNRFHGLLYKQHVARILAVIG